MNIDEFDFRLSPTRQILSALSQGLQANHRSFLELGDRYEEYQLDDLCEHQNDLCGIAFVMAQTYITAAVSDVKKIRGTNQGMKKEDVLKIGGQPIGDTGLTAIQLCNTIADYYKHRDQ
jgi:hypothetical protein